MALARAAELERTLRAHAGDVAGATRVLASEMGLDPEELILASLLHDVGKLAIAPSILLKPGPLTRGELAAVRWHPVIGSRAVASVPHVARVAPAVLHHHERFDGRGYPDGLAGEAIPLAARVVAVADAFSAMIDDRPYGVQRTRDEACEELQRCAGTQFDPDVVRCFLAAQSTLNENLATGSAGKAP